jgi:S1-C subfamily serine protease
MEQIVRTGEVRRGRLGVQIQDVGPDIAESLRLPKIGGALIAGVEDGSPAEKAGLKPGDVIVAVDGKAIEGPADLRARIGLMPVGERIQMTAIRDGRPITLSARVENVPARLAEFRPPRLPGLTLRDIEPERQRAFGGGVLVAEVGRGSLAERSGLRAGDVVVTINRVAVDSVTAAKDILEQRTSLVALNVVRDGAAMLIIVQ